MSEVCATPPTRPDLPIGRIHDLVRIHAPSYWRSRPVFDHTRLDDSGIGFDSVGLVELLVACESELGVALPVDLRLDDGMTVGQLVELFRRAAAARE